MKELNVISVHIRNMLIDLGLDITDPHLVKTPERVAKMYAQEFFRNVNTEFTKEEYSLQPNIEKYDEIICSDKIEGVSICSHHLLPFNFLAWMMYIPDTEIIGASKFARCIDHYARRPQTQERLCHQIIENFMENVNPLGAMIVIRGHHGCFSGDTQILTEKGWFRFDELPKNLKVAQVDPLTLETDLVYPSNYIKQKNNFDFMYHYKNRRVDIFETPDHRMLLKSTWKKFKEHEWEFKTAAEAPNYFYLPTAFKWKGEDFQLPDIDLNISKEDFVSFMGLYLAEGSWKRDYRKIERKTSSIIIVQDSKSSSFEEIKNFLFRLFPDLVEHKQNNCSYFHINKQRKLAEYCRSFGDYCNNMFVPQEIKNSKRELLKKFLYFFYLGDGDKWHKKRKDKDSSLRVITSSSIQLIKDLQEMYAKIGVSMNLHKYVNTSYQKGEKYRLWEQKGKYKKSKGVSYVGKDALTIVPFKENVYCVTVPKGAIVIKRNDKISVIGNCMTSRGIRQRNNGFSTSAVRGIFKKHSHLEMKGYELINLSLLNKE